jgi:hypothetical protein
MTTQSSQNSEDNNSQPFPQNNLFLRDFLNFDRAFSISGDLWQLYEDFTNLSQPLFLSSQPVTLEESGSKIAVAITSRNRNQSLPTLKQLGFEFGDTNLTPNQIQASWQLFVTNSEEVSIGSVNLGYAETASIVPIDRQATLESPFKYGISSSRLGIFLPKALLWADPNPSQSRVSLPTNFRTATGQITFPTSNTVISVNYNGFTPQAQTAFQFAVDIWESLLDSPVPITVDASFAPLSPGVLGSAGPTSFWRDFPGAPQAGTWYANALANSLAGTDIDPSLSDIQAQFSSSFNWYYGTDGNVPSGQYSFVSVVLHELGHGLGFLGFMDKQGSSGSWGFGTGSPSIYDRFTENGSGQSLINTALFPNPSSALGSQLTSNNIFFDGTNANAANGGNRIKLYAPSVWNGGSSYSHLDEVFNNTPNALMTYSIAPGESILNPGPVTLGLFKDLGWKLAATRSSSLY